MLGYCPLREKGSPCQKPLLTLFCYIGSTTIGQDWQQPLFYKTKHNKTKTLKTILPEIEYIPYYRDSIKPSGSNNCQKISPISQRGPCKTKRERSIGSVGIIDSNRTKQGQNESILFLLDVFRLKYLFFPCCN